MSIDEKNKELIYVYGFIPTWELKDKKLDPFPGIDQQHDSYVIKVKEIAAIVCLVNHEEYSQHQLEINLDNPLWIQEKGTHHHQYVALLNHHFTVIPVSLCTIFTSEERLEEVLLQRYDVLCTLFLYLEQKEEWTVKVYYDEKKFEKFVIQNNPTVGEIRTQLEGMPKGRQYFAQKKLDRVIKQEVENEAEARWKQLLQPLQNISSRFCLNKIWSKKATGKKEEMVCNSAFLLETQNVDPFISKVGEYQQAYQEEGWIFECTGPWPPYHFAALKREESS